MTSFCDKVQQELHEWFDKRHKGDIPLGGGKDDPQRKDDNNTSSDYDKSKLKLDKYSRRDVLPSTRKGKTC